jgi:hypothetical protein
MNSFTHHVPSFGRGIKISSIALSQEFVFSLVGPAVKFTEFNAQGSVRMTTAKGASDGDVDDS